MIKGPDFLLDIAAYKPGASEEEIRRTYGLTKVVKLASNENPFGPSPLALEAATEALKTSHRYNDGGMALREAISNHTGLSTEHITVNNGSDALIHQLMRTLLLPGETALSCRGGFVSFGIAVKSVGRTPVYVPQAAGYKFDVEALADAIDASTKVVYVPNPNNPTGTHLTSDELSYLLEHIPERTLLILDEAYAEYAAVMAPDTYVSGLTIDRPNVLTLRTFSKAFGLAALRIGYAVAHPDLIKWLLKTKLPFDPNGIGCAAAVAALRDQAHVDHTVRETAKAMELLLDTLRNQGYTTSESVANFVFVDCGTTEQAADFYMALLHSGFITRPLTGFGLPSAVRISIGKPDQNERLAEALVSMTGSFVKG